MEDDECNVKAFKIYVPTSSITKNRNFAFEKVWVLIHLRPNRFITPIRVKVRFVLHRPGKSERQLTAQDNTPRSTAFRPGTEIKPLKRVFDYESLLMPGNSITVPVSMHSGGTSSRWTLKFPSTSIITHIPGLNPDEKSSGIRSLAVGAQLSPVCSYCETARFRVYISTSPRTENSASSHSYTVYTYCISSRHISGTFFI